MPIDSPIGRSLPTTTGASPVIKACSMLTISADMRCDERDRLLEEYRIALAAYSHVVSELQRRESMTSRKECDDLHRIVQNARSVSDLALADLHRHILNHGC